MNKKRWTILIVVGVILVMVAGWLAIPQVLGNKQVEAVSPVDEALLATVTSHLKWDTLQGEAEIVWYGPNGETQTYTSTFALQQPDKANIAVISVDGTGMGGTWISDGERAYDVNTTTQAHAGMTLPTFSRDLSMLPATLEEAKNADAIYRHPFGMLIPSPVGDYLYPQWFAQGGGTYTFTGEETLLGRKVWVVEHENNLYQVTAWIDEETGVILKYSQKGGEKQIVDVAFTHFQVNQPVDPSLFVVAQD